jgi:hypothetical protein
LIEKGAGRTRDMIQNPKHPSNRPSFLDPYVPELATPVPELIIPPRLSSRPTEPAPPPPTCERKGSWRIIGLKSGEKPLLLERLTDDQVVELHILLARANWSVVTKVVFS